MRNTHERHEVQRYLGQTKVVLQSGMCPDPPPGHGLIQICAAGFCASDRRVNLGDKWVNVDNSDRPITLGHEAVGIITALGKGETELERGDFVVILPHVYPTGFSGKREPRSIGRGIPQHMGWDTNGVFADLISVPFSNLVRIAPKHLLHAAKLAPSLPCGSLFALTEPILCVLSGYYEMEQASQRFLRRKLTPGRAIVIGSGPMGYLNALVLLNHGWQVSIMDELPERAGLVRSCLNNQVQLFDFDSARDAEFDLAMVTASSADAIHKGEEAVRANGIVYLFAGLGVADRDEMDKDQVIFYENIHRKAHPVHTIVSPHDKPLLYAGHSGYWDSLAPQAITTVAANAAELDWAVTGIIRGWKSPSIESRLPGGTNWVTDDGSAAIISVLNGTNLWHEHVKLLILPGDTSRRLQVSSSYSYSIAAVS